MSDAGPAAGVGALVTRILDGPRGPRVGAYLDLDGTVIDGASVGAFLAHLLRTRRIGAGQLARAGRLVATGVRTPEEFDEALGVLLQAWAGHDDEELAQVGRRLFRTDLAARMRPEVRELVRAHRERGHRVVLATSGTRYQAEPVAAELDVDDVLCTPVELDGGALTGRAAGPALWGPAKAEAVRHDAAGHGVDLAASHAYSDGDEDVPLLRAVGHPVAVCPGDGLRTEARDRGWPVLRASPRGRAPGVTDLLRTAGFYGGFAGAFGVGLGLGALHRSRRQVWEFTAGVGADLGLALAGVEVEVLRGAGNLWSARPCVFVFNHQSNIDAIVVMKLLRGGFTGVAKKEARDIPGFGQLFRLADVAFVDRSDGAKAREALAPAVLKLRDEGVSLAMSPEGTRSPTPRLGRFKKGAFHIAMQAGVPMVPIVLRGAGEVLHASSSTIRAGRIEVVVGEPVDTSAWRAETVDEHVAHVRAVVADTLEHWPSRAGRHDPRR